MSGALAAPQGPPGGLLQDTDLSQILGPAHVEPARNSISMMLDLSRPDMDRYGAAMEALSPELPDELEPYEAGLRPMVPPAGTEWQEEIIIDRIARNDDSIEAQMQSYFEAAQAYDNALSTDRIKASEYYAARPFGDEEPGRSQLVLSVVRDTVRATLPSLLRIFTGVENPVEFVPMVAENEQLGLLHADLARKCTQYAHWGIFVANDGWMVLHDALLNALTRKVGWIRWRWGSQRAVRIEECNNLLAPQLQFLLQESGITAQRIARRPMLPHELRAVAATPEGDAYLKAGGEPMFYSARITRHAARGWPVVEAVMNESVWVVADADNPAKARAIFHVRDVPCSDLIEAGLPREEVLHCAGSGTLGNRQRREAVARDRASGQNIRAPNAANDPSMMMVRYVEGWCQMDTDGDYMAELIHTHAIAPGGGGNPKLIQWDRTDEIPLAAMVPYREPGRIIGFSQADMVMDLQRTQSRVMRAILDSLGQAIFPRTVVQLGAVTIEDARQTAIGSIIRVTQQGAVQELTKPFMGQQALGVMESLDAVRESRTGITRTSQGLTAESLQSTTPTAVNAQTSAAQDRIDMIARTCAQTGLAPLYQGMARMLARNQDRPNVLSIRGRWVTIDPRALSLQWAVQVNVGHRGTPSERLAMLNAVAQKQEQILAPAIAMGALDTPLVGLKEYRNTLARMVETAGFSDVVSYFKELPPDWQPPAPPPPKPTTDELLAQVESLKVQATATDDQASQEFDRLKLMIEDERSRLETALKAWTDAWSTSAQYGTPVPSLTNFQDAVRGDPSAALQRASASSTPGTPAMPTPPPGGLPPGGTGAPVARPLAAGAFPAIPAIRGAPSAPNALPPNAAPANTALGISPETAIALRQRLLGGGASDGLAGRLLAARSAMPQR